MNNTKKQRKTIEWERLAIASRKLGDMKVTFHARMGSINGKNGKDLTEKEEIKKRWHKYTKELY